MAEAAQRLSEAVAIRVNHKFLAASKSKNPRAPVTTHNK